jgi:hypothetical protein
MHITHTDLVPQRDPAIRPGNGPDI